MLLVAYNLTHIINKSLHESNSYTMPLKLFTMEGRDTFSKLQQIRKTANNLLPAVRAKQLHEVCLKLLWYC